ncbi:MAG TPA: methyltransferase domain-containing protein [Bryobacteraceae bacterium]|jgi:SAM-dependent methyltransferase
MIETAIYQIRFSEKELEASRSFWRPIGQYLQRWVARDGCTLDLGAGYCHFLWNIESADKIAVDVNEEALRTFAPPDVRCVTASGADLSEVRAGSVDTVFASNVYEHFPSREETAASFREVRRVLRPGGRFIVLQPNFAYCQREYFDFFDHRLVFTHRGMAEGIQSAGFEIERVIPRFLPYTSKSRLPKAPWLVSLYLKTPLAWRLLGGQMLIVARQPAATLDYAGDRR